jgi:F-type H+-transporting ATPase subunit epsilon
MAESAKIQLELVTPDGARRSELVDSLTAPSVEGELGILPGHRPLLAALKTGIVTYSVDGEGSRVATGNGFLEFSGDHAILLIERFVRQQDLDPIRARLELKEADEAIEQFAGDPSTPEYATLVSRELWAAAQLELHGDPPPPIVRSLAEFEAQPVEPYGLAEAVEPAESADAPAPPEPG